MPIVHSIEFPGSQRQWLRGLAASSDTDNFLVVFFRYRLSPFAGRRPRLVIHLAGRKTQGKSPKVLLLLLLSLVLVLCEGAFSKRGMLTCI